MYGDVIPPTFPKQNLFVMKQPVGVVAAITPWNFPLAMICRKCAPAMAAGCPIVVKPSEYTPLSALALASLAEKAGIPPGVFQVVTGDGKTIGVEMTRNPQVRKLSFTGSTPIGKTLFSQIAPTLKKLSLELGGSAPFIVFADAPLPEAISGLLAAKFRNSGQACIAADRIFIQDLVFAPFVQALVSKVSSLKVGDGLTPGVEIGPLIHEKAVEKIERHLQDAVAKGAKILCGGKRHSLGSSFYEPTVLIDVTPAMEIFQEETFGPIIPLIRFSDDNEAISLANATPYGLASYVYTKNIDKILYLLEALEFGMISVNGASLSQEVSPFGGIKESGMGREGSKYGIEEFLELKSVAIATPGSYKSEIL